MPKIMVADRPISILHHEDKSYKPGRDGAFEIEDRHVDGVRAHGLVLKEEAVARQRAKGGAAADAAKDAEIASLKARVAELEKPKA